MEAVVVKQLTVDEVVLDRLKNWLQENRHPEDIPKLMKTVGILRKLDVELSEAERDELRVLVRDCFGITDAQLQEVMPSSDEEPQVEIWGRRTPMPEPPGWIKYYLKLVSGQESPVSFHLFGMLTCIGAALGRRTRLDRTFFKVWPNMSVVLTGPAGGPRKTSACEMASSTVRAGFKSWQRRAIMDATPPAMVEELGTSGKKDSIGFIMAPEFRTFFPNQQFMEGAVPLITRLLDNPDSHPVSRILRKGGALKNVTLSMLGGSTLDWLGKLPQDAQGGGFLTRILIVHEERANTAQPKPVRGRAAMAAALKNGLRGVETYGRGLVTLSADADAHFDKLYKDLRARVGVHPKLALYYNRKAAHLLKLALLLTLPAKVVSKKRLLAAEAILEWLEEPLPDVYRIIGMSKAGEYTKQVLDMLRAFGGKMTWSKLSREMKGVLHARDFRLAVDTLKGAGQIKEIMHPGEHVVVIRELGMVE